MKVAFYCGTKKGLAGVYNRGVRWLDRSTFSHCELVFDNGESASSSFMDGGVRFKEIDYTGKSDWVLVPIHWANEDVAREYFSANKEHKYDILGNVRFLFGFVRDSDSKLFCSEAVAGALGIANPWRLTPSALYEYVVYINNILEVKN
jgi:hypothetical protein